MRDDILVVWSYPREMLVDALKEMNSIEERIQIPNAFVDLLKKTLFRVEISSIKLLTCHA